MKNSYIVENNFVRIFLKRRNGLSDLETLIDLDDFDKINSYDGTFYSAKYPDLVGQYYAKITLYKGMIDGKPRYNCVRLHRIIMNFKYLESRKIDVDHINGDSLDNRKNNLRLSTRGNNLKNRSRINSNNKSGYRNVCLILGWYRIQLQINGVNHLFPEKFKDAKKAGDFAEKMRKKYYKE